ncbi:MAG TPA: PrsW family glutamic-type intramembrane protease [Dehalococcoidia bacterium]|nr:PrsW family glutamic-type intramembrane protease [Dehalococcoidia bacterium]
MNRRQLITVAGAGIAFLALLVNLEFFFRPGVDDVLGGLAHHAFVLGCMLLLTVYSRTVSLRTLGIFWLLGVWTVYAVAYQLESQLASLLGVSAKGEFVGVWLAPFVEETTKLLPVAVFFLLASRRGYRHPSMSDGMLLGFMVGAGVSFQEDAQLGSIQLSGAGWGAATPWAAIFPTISPVGQVFALNHALWAALSGLSIGTAVMLRHWRLAWPIALVGPLLSLTNHMMLNHFAGNVFELVGRAKVPQPFLAIRDLTDGGRLPMLVLIVGVLAVVAGEWLILRWAGKRDRMFPPLSASRVFGLFARAPTKAGFGHLLAAERYLRLRNSIYYAGWQTKLTGGSPGVTDTDHDQLTSLVAPNVLPSPGTQPDTSLPADTPATPSA